jgi:hypothetical protein
MPGANLVVISEKSLDKLKMLVLLPPQIEYLRTQYVMTADDQKNKSREFVFRDNPEVRKLLGMKDEPGEYLD